VNGAYGRAGTGLSANTGWAVSDGAAKAGAGGEKKTEELLAQFAGKAAVLHDLTVPIPGFKANIDHVVVTGRRVLLIDTKVWKPGFYWTLFGVNRRGFERVDHTAKDQSYITRAVTSYLKGTEAQVCSPVLAVWCSRANGSVSIWALSVPGASVLNGSALAGVIRRSLVRKPADPVIVAKLSRLLVAAPAQAPSRYLDDADPFAA
jgi:hypothetical protein